MSVEVIEVLKFRGHEVNTVQQFGISWCFTAVMLDHETENKIAAANPC